MAEGMNLVEKSLEELERDITCAICQDHYTQPMVLPCCHYYCKQCILKLALKTGTDKPFSCPECRKETTLPEGSVDQFPIAFFVNRLKATFATLERAHGKMEVKCEGCSESGAKAEAFCRQCATFICQECIKSHTRLNVFDGHEVVSLQELKQGGARKVIVKSPPTKKCVVHEEPLTLYCFDCDSLICRDCTVKDHRDHNFEFSKIAAPNTKTKLLEKLEPLREMEVSLSHALEEIQTTKHELEAQGDSVASTIETSFQELHEIQEKRKQEVLEETGRVVQEKLDKLSLQEKNLFLARVEVQSVLDYTDQCVRHCTNNEVMSMHAEIRRRIEREIKEHGKSGRSLELVEEVDIGVEVRCAQVLQQLCQTKAKINQLPIDLSSCTAIVEGAITSEANKVNEATSTMIMRLSNNKPTKLDCEVDFSLKSLFDGSIIKHSIRMIPSVRGRHQLTVSVYGEEIASSPFPVCVSIPPTQLGKPLHLWRDGFMPTGITVNSVGEVIVIKSEGDVIWYNKEGKIVRTVKVKHKMTYGVAVDGEDNVYCTGSGKIFKCNKNGGNLQVHEVKSQMNRGVAVVGNEVMVCEFGKKGTIMVYNEQLRYVRQIVDRGVGQFYDLSSDGHGNLYVTDYDESCIRVFSKDYGKLIRSFGCDGNGVKKLKIPRFVCVAGQYVYVTNDGYHNVSVFTTEGTHVTSFGQHGNKEGDFNNPCGVCVNNGYVYVSDQWNYRVQVF